MKRFHPWLSTILASCVLVSPLDGQVAPVGPHKGSWEAVESLPRGTLITVKSALTDGSVQTVHCLFHSANAVELVCGHYVRPRPVPYPVYTPANPDRYVFLRQPIVQVHIENENWETTQSSLAGAFAGATLGGIAGFNCCGAKGGERITGAFGLSLIGAIVGGIAGRFAPLVKGHVLYQR